MASLDTSTRTVATWHDWVATGLMLLAAIGACTSFVTSITSVATASPATQVVEIWRMYGFVVFTGLYVLLAFWPRRYPGIWEWPYWTKLLSVQLALCFSVEGWQMPKPF